MKATGVVRRIDDLGRIVLPKELRRTMRIKEGDSLEIYIDGMDQIMLKKYSPVQSLNEFVKEFSESVYSSNKLDIVITDNERVIACAGNFKINLTGKKISMKLEEKLNKRQTQIIDAGDNFEICDNIEMNRPMIIRPINVYGDILGCVIILGDKGITSIEKSIAEFSGTFISKYLES